MFVISLKHENLIKRYFRMEITVVTMCFMTFCYTTVYTTVVWTAESCVHLQMTPIKLTITSKLFRDNAVPTSHFYRWSLCRLHSTLFYLPSWIVVALTGGWSICRWWSLEQLVLILSWLLQLTGEKKANPDQQQNPVLPSGSIALPRGHETPSEQADQRTELTASQLASQREKLCLLLFLSPCLFLFFSQSLSLLHYHYIPTVFFPCILTYPFFLRCVLLCPIRLNTHNSVKVISTPSIYSCRGVCDSVLSPNGQLFLLNNSTTHSLTFTLHHRSLWQDS